MSRGCAGFFDFVNGVIPVTCNAESTPSRLFAGTGSNLRIGKSAGQRVSRTGKLSAQLCTRTGNPAIPIPFQYDLHMYLDDISNWRTSESCTYTGCDSSLKRRMRGDVLPSFTSYVDNFLFLHSYRIQQMFLLQHPFPAMTIAKCTRDSSQRPQDVIFAQRHMHPQPQFYPSSSVSPSPRPRPRYIPAHDITAITVSTARHPKHRSGLSSTSVAESQDNPSFPPSKLQIPGQGILTLRSATPSHTLAEGSCRGRIGWTGAWIWSDGVEGLRWDQSG
jgi:hypothetical protein